MRQTKLIIAGNLLLLFSVIGYQIVKKERVLHQGELILMKLRPVDPISYMQGFYMTLDYAETRTNHKNHPTRGYLIVTIDDNRVAKQVRFQANPTPINEEEYCIKYYSSYVSSWDVNIGAESYFFEEGSAKRFEAAEYGGLHVRKNGDALLANLYDENFKLIEP